MHESWEAVLDAARERAADMAEREAAGVTAGDVLGWCARLQRAVAGSPLEIAAAVGEVARDMHSAAARAMAAHGPHLHLAADLCRGVTDARVQQVAREIAVGQYDRATGVSLLSSEALDGEQAERETVREVERTMARRLGGGDAGAAG